MKSTMFKYPEDNHKVLKLAQKTALKAAGLLKQNNDSIRHINKEFHHDVKIEADLQSEKLIVEALTENSPYSIISEECGEIEGTEKDYSWIIDPVDGSLNYAHQIPMNCVSIGLWKKDKPVLGVIYDFNHDEMFSGIVGEGAWLNKKTIKVSATKDKAKAMICTGFPNSTDYSSEAIQTFIKQVQQFRKARLFGTAALSIAYVACGRTDAYYESDIMLWDIAAGMAIVEAAGGRCQVEKLGQRHTYKAYITNGNLG